MHISRAPVNLQELFAGTGVTAPPLTVTDIASSSRDVAPGGLFLACAGRRSHGLEFLAPALDAGAAAVAWEPADGIDAPGVPAGVVQFRAPGLSARLGELGDRFFGRPSAELAVTGITGTNGKTTVAYIVNQALNRLNHVSGYSGTLGWGAGNELVPSRLTTPGSIELHRRLRAMRERGAEHVVAEMSSHALDQGRADGVRFKVAALTNLSQDHLDYHGSMEAYAEAKARLFTASPIHTAVINVGDGFGARLINRLPPGVDNLSVALVSMTGEPPEARLVGRLAAADARGLGLKLHGDFGEALLSSPLWGRFNAENLVVAVGILLALDVSLGDAADALTECFAPPGRMERIAPTRQPAVIVDFAHTPDALANVLATIREHTRGDLWCVFGCGGDRDRSKRAPMGTIAAESADRVIVTDDNPRSENSGDIIDAIVSGIPSHVSVDVLPDRAEAIGYAIEAAAPLDVVLIAGKGDERTQIIGTEIRPFSDAEVACAALEARP